MKKTISMLSLLSLALLLGAGMTVMMAGDAQAIMCDTYSVHIIVTGNQCGCGDGRVGTTLLYCPGYWADGSDCGCWSYCSPCPPKQAYLLPAEYVPPVGGY